MKTRRKRTAQRLILLVMILILSACGGGHDGSGVVLSTTNMIVGQALSDTVVRSGFNPYVAAVTPGALYKISITDLTDDADLVMYGADNTFTISAQCAVDNSSIIGASNEDCIIASPGSTLYFAVNGTFAVSPVAVYTIDIERLALTNLNLSFPFADAAEQTTAQVYAVPATPDVAYTLSITGLTDDADLHIFGNDGSFANQAPCSLDNTRFTGTTPEDCSLTSFGGTLFFIVDGIFSTAPTLAFTATASPTPVVASPVSEGTITAPIGVQLDIPSPGQVGQAEESFYVVNGLTAGTRYTVSITGLSGDADLVVYGSGSPFTNKAACFINNTGFVGIQAEDCTLLVSGNTLFFSVTAHTLSGGVAFISLVSPGP